MWGHHIFRAQSKAPGTLFLLQKIAPTTRVRIPQQAFTPFDAARRSNSSQSRQNQHSSLTPRLPENDSRRMPKNKLETVPNSIGCVPFYCSAFHRDRPRPSPSTRRPVRRHARQRTISSKRTQPFLKTFPMVGGAIRITLVTARRSGRRNRRPSIERLCGSFSRP